VLDVVVTCLPHEPELAIFPQVRGYYLAKHLARSGLRAEFRQLPQPELECTVLICSEYQQPIDAFDRDLRPSIEAVQAERKYCMTAFSLRQEPNHFSRAYCEWFGARGGVLVHLPNAELEPFERCIGLGVDREVVDLPRDVERNRILFDFPRSRDEDASAAFDRRMLDAARAAMAGCVFVGSGPGDSPIRDLFDDWVEYGQTHAAFTQACLREIVAFVPGWGESMGLQVAEAQVAGAAIVSTRYDVPDVMRCPHADIRYRADEPETLVEGLREARRRDHERIRAEAAARFDYFAVAKRTRKAIGV
jgi:hypothetical protein